MAVECRGNVPALDGTLLCDLLSCERQSHRICLLIAQTNARIAAITYACWGILAPYQYWMVFYANACCRLYMALSRINPTNGGMLIVNVFLQEGQGFGAQQH